MVLHSDNLKCFSQPAALPLLKVKSISILGVDEAFKLLKERLKQK